MTRDQHKWFLLVHDMYFQVYICSLFVARLDRHACINALYIACAFYFYGCVCHSGDARTPRVRTAQGDPAPAVAAAIG